jgi:hypothetical protein
MQNQNLINLINQNNTFFSVKRNLINEEYDVDTFGYGYKKNHNTCICD